jgi:hypothetical protein
MVDFDSVPVCPVAINYRFDAPRRLSPEDTVASMNVVSSIWTTSPVRILAVGRRGACPGRAAGFAVRKAEPLVSVATRVVGYSRDGSVVVLTLI